MSTNIPDQISADALNALLVEKTADNIIDECRAEARAEQAEKEAIFEGHTESEVITIAEAAVDCAIEECEHPIVHKVMALSILHKYIAWHETMAEHALENNDIDNAFAWSEDVGKLKQIHAMLCSVEVSPNDFTVDK